MDAYGNASRIKDFQLEVAKGNIPGTTSHAIIGRNQDIDTLTIPEVLWEQGGLLTWTANGGAPYFISSSDVNDVHPILVFLLTEDANGNWNEEPTIVVLNGQTKTPIVTVSGNNPRWAPGKYGAGMDFDGGGLVYPPLGGDGYRVWRVRVGQGKNITQSEPGIACCTGIPWGPLYCSGGS